MSLQLSMLVTPLKFLRTDSGIQIFLSEETRSSGSLSVIFFSKQINGLKWSGSLNVAVVSQ